MTLAYITNISDLIKDTKGFEFCGCQQFATVIDKDDHVTVIYSNSIDFIKQNKEYSYSGTSIYVVEEPCISTDGKLQQKPKTCKVCISQHEGATTLAIDMVGQDELDYLGLEPMEILGYNKLIKE